MAAGLRVDVYRTPGHRHRNGLCLSGHEEWRWRMWSSSSIVGQSSEGYDRRSRALANLEMVLNGTFKRISTAQHPTPFGLLSRVSPDGEWTVIPVRLKS